MSERDVAEYRQSLLGSDVPNLWRLQIRSYLQPILLAGGPMVMFCFKWITPEDYRSNEDSSPLSLVDHTLGVGRRTKRRDGWRPVCQLYSLRVAAKRVALA